LTTVFVGTATTRDIPPAHVMSLLYLNKPERMYYDLLPNMPPDVGKNELLRRALLREDCEYFMLLDSDATIHPDTLFRLLAWKLPVVSACIYTRAFPPVPTMGWHEGINKDGHHVYNFGKTIQEIRRWAKRHDLDADTLNEIAGKKQPDSDLMEIDGCGTHCMLIRRDVLEAIGGEWFKCTGLLSGEDFDFCRKVQAAGYQIYADLGCHSGHIVGNSLIMGLKYFIVFYDGIVRKEETWVV